MARGALAFKQTDVVRAVKAARAAGLEIGRIEIERNGRIVIIPGPANQIHSEGEGANEWDDVLQ